MENKNIYRGKNAKGDWVKGGLIIFDKGECLISFPEADNWSYFYDEPPSCEIRDEEVREETVAQCTGVKGIRFDELTHEKCDCDIFEGDIVLVTLDGENLFEGVVGYKDGAFIINTNPDIFTFYQLLNPDEKSPAFKFEFVVLGNKWDNPEMFREIFDE